MSNITADIVVSEDTAFETRLTPSIGGGPIAVLEWGDGFKVLLSSRHPRQADTLREWAHQLTALAHEVDQARDQHEPKGGYDAPVPFVPTEGAYDERRAAEVTQ